MPKTKREWSLFNDNHVHILIKTGEKPLGQFIGKMNSKYAKCYNKKYNYMYIGKEKEKLIKI